MPMIRFLTLLDYTSLLQQGHFFHFKVVTIFQITFTLFLLFAALISIYENLFIRSIIWWQKISTVSFYLFGTNFPGNTFINYKLTKFSADHVGNNNTSSIYMLLSKLCLMCSHCLIFVGSIYCIIQYLRMRGFISLLRFPKVYSVLWTGIRH